MGKVYRQDRKTVQLIKAKEIVPGDIVEIAGEFRVCQRFSNIWRNKKRKKTVNEECILLWFNQQRRRPVLQNSS